MVVWRKVLGGEVGRFKSSRTKTIGRSILHLPMCSSLALAASGAMARKFYLLSNSVFWSIRVLLPSSGHQSEHKVRSSSS